MNETDYKLMQMAIEEAAESEGTNPKNPKVGAIVLKGAFFEKAHRGEKKHAEFQLLQKTRSSELLEGATLYTTLEPCTTRSHDKLPCVEWALLKKIKRVVIGILDPNPNICGRSYWRLVDTNVEVDFFPEALAREIRKLNENFIHCHRGGGEYGSAFAWMLQHHKNPVITPYPGLGWGDALSLQDSPNLREGWPASLVGMDIEDAPFEMSCKYASAYKHYFTTYFSEKRFKDDGDKFMIASNPIAFSDSPSLDLRMRATKYSQVQFYLDNVATIAGERSALIEELVKGSLSAAFPHSLCLHIIVATSDGKLLLTRRSPKVRYHPGSWSCSVEENLAPQDVAKKGNLLAASQRALREELGLTEDAYHNDDIRVLSVFLEADILNVSICLYVQLGIDSATLTTLLAAQPRTDYEFTEWQLLDFSRTGLLRELTCPPRRHHPTTGYRLLLALLKQYGEPTQSDMSELGLGTP